MLSITKKTFWTFLIVMMLFQALALPFLANANGEDDDDWFGITSSLKGGFLWVFMFIPYLVGSFGSLFLQFAAGLVDLMLAFNIGVLGGGNIVTLGFGISLNIVNLLFVLALIIIAFGTILRLEKYGIKQLLAKLIIAAILINFSLAIAGLLLDFSHIFTTFFLSGGQTTSSSVQISDNLAVALQPQALTEPPSLLEAYDFAVEGLFWAAIMSSMFRAVFTWILAIVMLGVAFMFLIRYFYIVILLILMPFAWFFWVIPEYGGLSKKWWDKFLEQVFFLPGMAFFIYLAIQLQGKLTGAFEKQIAGSQAATAFSQGLGASGGGVDFFTIVLNQIIISGILVGGLIAAQKMGIAGSSTAMGFGKAMRQGFTGVKPGWINRLGKNIGEKTAAGVARIPVARTLFSPLSANVRKAVKQRGVAAEVKNSSQIASDVRSGKLSLDTARARAGSTWRRFVPGFSRQRANSILALAQLESGGKYTVGGAEGAEWEHPEVSEKEARLIKAARERHSKIAKEKAGPSLEEKVKKLEEKLEEEKEKT